MKINLPNRITLARLLLAVFFFVLLAQFDVSHPNVRLLDVCTVLFIIAALTDWLDGYLARKRNQVTAMGRVLDPFVDKVLVCGTFVFLAGASFRSDAGVQVSAFQPWMAVLILGRELLVTGLRGFSEARGISFGAVGFGKAKMVLQSIAAPVLMFLVAHPGVIAYSSAVDWLKLTLVWATVIVTAASMLPYLIHSKDIFAEADVA
jgi:CDP-diacylglycerol--glycerol-3-phosphate 3-phosphatidyltransferase